MNPVFNRDFNRDFNWDFNWKVSFFALACLLLFLGLGNWQLDRAQEKTLLLARQEARASQPAQGMGALPLSGDLAGLPVRLTGELDGKAIFLLDNRVLDGRVGFEVHQVFHDVSGLALLVNRGFVPQGRTRNDPVTIPPVTNPTGELRGRVYQSVARGRVRQGESMSRAEFPLVVQHIDQVQFGDLLGIELYPHVIRLEEGEPGALPRYWPVTVMQPARHRAYAVQWFAMALAVTIAWGFFSFRKMDKNDDRTSP